MTSFYNNYIQYVKPMVVMSNSSLHLSEINKINNFNGYITLETGGVT